MTRGALALLAVLASGCAAAPPPLETVSNGGYAMGTLLEVTLVGSDGAALEASLRGVFEEVERLEALLSSWRPDSDVSRLNRAAGGEALRVDPEVAALLERAASLSRRTRGSFDVTVGPLVALWNEAAARDVLPTPQALAAACARVGAHVLRFAPDGRVGLATGSALNLGGLAKGYALDRAREKLPAEVEAALLSFGQSSAWAVGQPPDGDGWRLLARAPEGGFAGVLTLRDQALSVSGSLGQWNEIGGRRYGHVLDPRSGRPLTRRRQALVVAADATDAEALSKALLVLGETEGLALVEAWEGAEALLLDADGSSWRSTGWNAATRFEALEPATQGGAATLRSGG